MIITEEQDGETEDTVFDRWLFPSIHQKNMYHYGLIIQFREKKVLIDGRILNNSENMCVFDKVIQILACFCQSKM